MEKKIITISREFGSGGRTIGRLVAEKLGIPFYDKELVCQGRFQGSPYPWWRGLRWHYFRNTASYGPKIGGYFG